MSPKPPTRRVSSKARKRTIFVVAEGKTEHQYLMAFAREHRDKVALELSEVVGRVPRQLVEEAVARAEDARRDQRRHRGDAYDSVWCVFDEDTHPGIPEAMALAVSKGVNVAFSAPCFELWLMLHYQDHSAWVSGDDIQIKLKGISGIDKTIPQSEFPRLIGGFEEAKQRAVQLSRRHESAGDSSRSNPSSSMWRLIDEIRAA